MILHLTNGQLVLVITLGGCVGMMVFGYLGLLGVRKRNAISKAVPQFISQLVESLKTGMILSRALILIAETNESKEFGSALKSAASKIKKGMPVSRALDGMAVKLDNSLFTQVSSVISNVEETGGNVTTILGKLQDFMTTNIRMSTTRLTAMATYAMVVFINSVVLTIVLLLGVHSVFPPLTNGGGVGALTGGNLSFGMSQSEAFILSLAFFITAFAYAAGNGIIAGVFTHASPKAGLLYGGVLAAVTTILFFMFSGGMI